MSNTPNPSRDGSKASFDEAALRDAIIQAVWGQWACLGAHAVGASSKPRRSIIDPEALLLFTLYLEPQERRLRDFAYWWAQVGAHLLSVQRTKTLLQHFPSVTETRLSDFATWAVAAGDNRWKRHAGSDAPSPTDKSKESLRGTGPRPGKGSDRPRLDLLPALVLRLRAGFGISAKADVLAYLLGIEERSARTRAIADATHYSRATVANALKDLCDAGFIQKTTGAVAEYVAVFDQWAPILNGPQSPPGVSSAANTSSAADEAPVWRYWAGLFAFLADADQWIRDTAAASDYLRSSSARDVFGRHRAALENNQIRVPSPKSYRGPAYLEGFADTLRRVVQWLSAHP
ncbi:helix-turn-helix domain-containing protein [Salisaeta longa]|uniref:helix-turn-helix domain-containing protein n=1 Tax=Salisaeta longa TaxID=503170 RepID=UPI0003B38FF4|nr:helix-turn-helix domain-containing protein [Salisaeta longa]